MHRRCCSEEWPGNVSIERVCLCTIVRPVEVALVPTANSPASLPIEHISLCTEASAASSPCSLLWIPGLCMCRSFTTTSSQTMQAWHPTSSCWRTRGGGRSRLLLRQHRDNVGSAELVCAALPVVHCVCERTFMSALTVLLRNDCTVMRSRLYSSLLSAQHTGPKKKKKTSCYTHLRVQTHQSCSAAENSLCRQVADRFSSGENEQDTAVLRTHSIIPQPSGRPAAFRDEEAAVWRHQGCCSARPLLALKQSRGKKQAQVKTHREDGSLLREPSSWEPSSTTAHSLSASLWQTRCALLGEQNAAAGCAPLLCWAAAARGAACRVM